MEAKHVVQSKTIIFNVVTGLMLVAAQLAPILEQVALLGIEPGMVVKAQAIVGLINVLGNLYLRTVTSAPVRFRLDTET